jgi:hypothetical protein
MGGGTGRCDTEIVLFLADCPPTGKQSSDTSNFSTGNEIFDKRTYQVWFASQQKGRGHLGPVELVAGGNDELL